MKNNREQAWPIYVDGTIVEVYVTTGTDEAMARRQAEGKKNTIAKDHVPGAVRMEGPFDVSRK